MIGIDDLSPGVFRSWFPVKKDTLDLSYSISSK